MATKTGTIADEIAMWRKSETCGDFMQASDVSKVIVGYLEDQAKLESALPQDDDEWNALVYLKCFLHEAHIERDLGEELNTIASRAMNIVDRLLAYGGCNEETK